MTVIYIDSLFLLNLTVNYLLLLCTARIAGEQLYRLRFALAAAMGALYACAVFLPGLSFLRHIACQGAAAAVMALIAFGGARRLFRLLVLFLALACALGGVVLALGMAGGRMVGIHGGILFPRMDLKVVLLSAAVCYVLLGMLLRKLSTHGGNRGRVVPVVVELSGRKVALRALVDTGNTLTDPLSGKPVLVVEGSRLLPLFPHGQTPTVEEMRDPANALERLSDGALKGKLRLMPYRAVGVERGLLLCLRADKVTVDGRDCGGLLVALSPGVVTENGNHNALIGAF